MIVRLMLGGVIQCRYTDVSRLTLSWGMWSLGHIGQCIFEKWLFSVLWWVIETPKSGRCYGSTVSYSSKPWTTFDAPRTEVMKSEFGLTGSDRFVKIKDLKMSKCSRKLTPKIQNGRLPVGLRVWLQETLLHIGMLHEPAQLQLCW